MCRKLRRSGQAAQAGDAHARRSIDTLALGEHARATRLGDLERALVLALRDQHVHVVPIELDQLR